eukprot:gene12890-14876_t
MACLFISVVGPLILNAITDDQINQLMVVDSTSSDNYNIWQNNVEGDGAEHVKLKYNLYYFQVQNMAETLQGQRPKLMQVGPYAYDEYYVKFDIKFSDHGDTVSYNTQKYYIFNQEETGPGLTEDDQITLPYAVVIGFEFFLQQVPVSASDLLQAAIGTQLVAAEGDMEAMMDTLYVEIQDTKMPSTVRQALLSQVATTNQSLQVFFEDMIAFVNTTYVGDLLLKVLMCGLPEYKSGRGLTPFWKTDPFSAWYGWLNDPMRMEIEKLLLNVQNKSANHTAIPWTNSVPGGAFNWTSIEETRRRRQPDVFKTGKRNPNQIGQYVRYQNMTEMWSCVVPVLSQNTSLYVEGEQFPACAYFQHDWTDEQALQAGYRKPFATAYANRISGTNGNGFGRPVLTPQVGLYLSEIYRSVYAAYKKDIDWHGVTTRRYGLQSKDLENATANPDNAQFYNFGPSGMENTTSAFGLPVFVSFPHFLHGDPRLIGAVEGLDPNEDVHDSIFDVEPQTGLPTLAHKRLQVNYQMTDRTLPTTDPASQALATAVCANISDIVTVLSGFRRFPYNISALTYDADDIKNTLYLIDGIIGNLQFWSLVMAGIFFAVLLAMLYRGHLDRLALGHKWHAAGGADAEAGK